MTHVGHEFALGPAGRRGPLFAGGLLQLGVLAAGDVGRHQIGAGHRAVRRHVRHQVHHEVLHLLALPRGPLVVDTLAVQRPRQVGAPGLGSAERHFVDPLAQHRLRVYAPLALVMAVGELVAAIAVQVGDQHGQVVGDDAGPLLAGGDLLLVGDAGRNVVQEGGRHVAVAVAQHAHRQLDRHFAAVAPHGRHPHPVVDDGPGAAGGEGAHAGHMVLAQPFRHQQHGDVAADRFFAAPAEGLLGLGIPFRDDAIAVAADEGVRRPFQDIADQRFAVARALLGHFTLGHQAVKGAAQFPDLVVAIQLQHLDAGAAVRDAADIAPQMLQRLQQPFYADPGQQPGQHREHEGGAGRLVAHLAQRRQRFVAGEASRRDPVGLLQALVRVDAAHAILVVGLGPAFKTAQRPFRGQVAAWPGVDVLQDAGLAWVAQQHALRRHDEGEARAAGLEGAQRLERRVAQQVDAAGQHQRQLAVAVIDGGRDQHRWRADDVAEERGRDDAAPARHGAVEVGPAAGVERLQRHVRVEGVEQAAVGCVHFDAVERFAAGGPVGQELVQQAPVAVCALGHRFGQRGQHGQLAGQVFVDMGRRARQQRILLVADHRFHVPFGQHQRHHRHRHGGGQHQQHHHGTEPEFQGGR